MNYLSFLWSPLVNPNYVELNVNKLTTAVHFGTYFIDPLFLKTLENRTGKNSKYLLRICAKD
jgi:hypothetical protein